MAKTPIKSNHQSISFIEDRSLLKWVGDFIDKHGLAGPSKKVVCGLSGGADSMLLAYVCEGLKNQGLLKSVRHVHIDHGLRAESGKEAFELKELTKAWGWDIRVRKVTGRPPKSNVEAWARKVRRHLLLGECQEDEVLFLAHHIDDSFEWFLRQTLGSSQGPLRQGIPLINGKVRRPFHCLSRKQISSFVKEFEIPTFEDQSNKDLRFQRNQIRHKVKKPLLDMFPKGMAHFVERSNQWAKNEGLTPGDHSQESSPDKGPRVDVYKWQKDVVFLIMREQGRWEEVRPLIIKTIQKLSAKKRGQIRQNLAKLFETLIEGQSRGPLKFSGGVEVAIYPGVLMILNQKGREKLVQATQNTDLKTSQIPEVSLEQLYAQVRENSLPFAFFQDKIFGLKGLKSDPYFQDAIDQGRKLNLYFRPLRHLELAASKQDRLNQKIQAFLLEL